MNTPPAWIRFKTQRLPGIENVDTIMVMDYSQIVEHGSRRELIAHKGLDRRMWDIQNQILTGTEDANI